MDKDIQEVLTRLKDGLTEIFGPRLKGVYLYGSYARGDADSESDIDVLIVLDHIENYSAEIACTSELIAQLSLDCGRSISRVFLPEQRWREDQTMFVSNVREEAVAA